MVGFMCNIAEEKEESEEQAGGKGENGDSWARSAVHAQHRRSKRCSFNTQINVVIIIVKCIFCFSMRWIFAFLSPSFHGYGFLCVVL